MGFLCLSGLVALAMKEKPGLSTFLAVAGNVAGCALGLVPAFYSILSGTTLSFRKAWDLPLASFSVSIDPLSAFFLIPILFLSLLSAIYGSGYIAHWYGKKNTALAWFFFNMLVASMVMVVTSRNGILFLIAWEIMSLASFFLVIFESEKEMVRSAGFTYLAATHLGTAFLFVLFMLLGAGKSVLDFDQFGTTEEFLKSVIFILAIIGFGTKAGFIPLHVWLPEAHPAAPSHVSALMSGVMIKTGIYGLIRVLTFLGTPPLWWGYLLISIGAVSGVLGVLFAVAQKDVKRLLAYCSVENIGIIALGIGIGLIGIHYGSPLVAVLGMAGALMHVVNHTAFKGLLFLGAGSVLSSTGTRDIDRLGGLLKNMPWTGLSFLIGAAAISGLPFLNGFISEFLIYSGAFKGLLMDKVTGMFAAFVVASLAVIGSLAVLCFTKAFGATFLGEMRSEMKERPVESVRAMRVPMFFLSAVCVVIGLFPVVFVRVLGTVLSVVTGMGEEKILSNIETVGTPLTAIMMSSWMFILSALAVLTLRKVLLSGRSVTRAVTWDCGYLRPSPRMQYTSSSFAQPVTKMFNFILRTKCRLLGPQPVFPRKASFETETPDVFKKNLYEPAFKGVDRAFLKLGWIQQGRLQYYVMYILVTLIILLIWELI